MGHIVNIRGVNQKICKYFCEKPGGTPAFTNKLKLSNCALKAKGAINVEGRSYPKIDHDKCDMMTKSIVEKIRSRKEYSIIKGLINFETGEMHLDNAGELGASCHHKDMAKQNNLLKNENVLKDGWYGFSINCGDLSFGDLIVSPLSDHYGGIPIEYAPVFERHMDELVGKSADRKTVEILYFQLLYQRGFTPREISYLGNLKGVKINMVSKSMPDDELRTYLSRG